VATGDVWELEPDGNYATAKGLYHFVVFKADGRRPSLADEKLNRSTLNDTRSLAGFGQSQHAGRMQFANQFELLEIF
jgi:hypothetical protein